MTGAETRVSFLDVKAQYAEIADELDQVVLEVLRGGVYVMGPHHNELEREIADLQGCSHGIGLNSGTDALRIMLDAAGVGPGDEVITTAFTFVASAETIVQTGARPVFVDIQPNSYMIDPNKIAAAITPKTKAIMPIHLFGQIAEAEAILEIANSHGIPVLEDAAQAVGSVRNGKLAGSFGLGAGLSFYVTKNLGAAGDAGMIVSNDDAFAERCRSIRIHGMGRERYYYDYVGYTSRLDEIQAAVLRKKLTRLDFWNHARRKLADIYFKELADVKGISLPEVLTGNEHTYHQFTIRSPKRNELKDFLKTREIDSMIYYPVPLHFHKPYAQFGTGIGSLPVTEAVCEEVLSLPIHQYLGEDQVRHVSRSIREFAASH